MALCFFPNVHRVYILSVLLEIVTKTLVQCHQQVLIGTKFNIDFILFDIRFYLRVHAQSIAVAASDINDRRASFSNYGPCVDLIAPVSYTDLN